ncbi:Maf family protein [Salisediminibacterium beveridgei]|uniref:dTTP/UTP pyrophosphatase n=1 Tax=Salisediminibacterium beveridgei TaxID=632773 RepID=A0A1D7QTL8_9BACI|nr:Maf family protein [Salisediminibacterium beveridgei]AOM82361.1 Septum formation protein Maf [Salisediminibacterium beveridgei]
MQPLILASRSPRRQELLKQVNIPFETMPSDVDESRYPKESSPTQYVETLACAKADHVLQQHPGRIVLGSDTVVVIGDKILGKPRDTEDAREMLKELSGQVHSVLTGVAILSDDRRTVFHGRADVRFYQLTDEDIQHYIDSGEPFDKAGAYGIQGLGAMLVEEIKGDYFTIVGMPVAQVVRAWRSFSQ